MRCTGEEKVLLAEFSLKDEDQVWWESIGRVHARDGVQITYEVFKMGFEKNCIPDVVRDKKATEFVQLIQVQMTISEYEVSSLNSRAMLRR